jgi:hypothetical protein
MQEVHEWRHKIYEETKHLSPKELVEMIRRDADEVTRQYGLKLKRSNKAA